MLIVQPKADLDGNSKGDWQTSVKESQAVVTMPKLNFHSCGETKGHGSRGCVGMKRTDGSNNKPPRGTALARGVR